MRRKTRSFIRTRFIITDGGSGDDPELASYLRIEERDVQQLDFGQIDLSKPLEKQGKFVWFALR